MEKKVLPSQGTVAREQQDHRRNMATRGRGYHAEQTGEEHDLGGKAPVAVVGLRQNGGDRGAGMATVMRTMEAISGLDRGAGTSPPR